MRALALVTIAALLIAVVVLGRAVVRLENYRYANSVGFCDKFDITDPQQLIARNECLDKVETRTHWFWHVIYGTGVL
jgi:hypothetical protein